MKRILFLAFALLLLVSCNKGKDEPNFLDTDVDKLNFTKDGGELPFKLTVDSKWEITGAPNWCELTPANGYGFQTVKVKPTPNENESAREAKLVIASGKMTKTVTVLQAGTNEPVSPPTTTITVPLAGGTANLAVLLTKPWTVTNKIEWCTLDKEVGTGPATVVLTLEAVTEARTTTITMTRTDLTTVKQNFVIEQKD